MEVKKGQCWEITKPYHKYLFYIEDVKLLGNIKMKCYAISYKDASRDSDFETGQIYLIPKEDFERFDIELIFDAGSGKSEHNRCCVCNDYNEYAESNQPDGSYKCYKCRKGL